MDNLIKTVLNCSYEIKQLEKDEIQVDDFIIDVSGNVRHIKLNLDDCYESIVGVLARKLAEENVILQNKISHYHNEYCKIAGRKNY
jgi:hypothetical protein